LVDVPSANVV